MKKYQKTLLAGAAALAIAAGTGFASAQSPGGASPGSSGSASQPHATQSAPSKSGEKSQREGTGMQRSGADSGMKSQAQKEPSSAAEKGKSAEDKGKSGSQKNAQGAGSRSRSAAEPQTQSGKRQAQKPGEGSTAQKGGAAERDRANRGTAERNRTNQGTAERNRTNQGTAERDRTNRERSLHGLQGNASEPMQGAENGGNVHFSDQQRTTIKRTVINARGAPRADHVDFDVRVGTVVPRGSIRVTTVPETLVRMEPRWRGYLYFVYEDEIVIVNPHDMHIVAVVPV